MNSQDVKALYRGINIISIVTAFTVAMITYGIWGNWVISLGLFPAIWLVASVIMIYTVRDELPD